MKPASETWPSLFTFDGKPRDSDVTYPLPRLTMEDAMVSEIGSQNRHTPQIIQHDKTGKSELLEGISPGKSADSVGHRARVMVAESDDTATGAQGRAASMIAKMDITVLAPEHTVETPAEAAPDGARMSQDIAAG
jgi:hypothetical protein